MSQLSIVLLILVLTIVAFLSGKLPYTVISVGTMIALIMTKILTVDQAFSGFVNSNVIMFAAMFVIGAGITKSGFLEAMGKLIMRYRGQPRKVLMVLMAVTIVLAVLSSAVGTMAILLPLIYSIANDLKISRSKLIYPVAVVANVSTACTFLGQGATNMSWSDVMMNLGAQTPFNIWSFTIARMPLIITSVIYGLFFAQKFLPDIPNENFAIGGSATTAELAVPKEKQVLARIISLATVFCMIVLDYFGIVPMYIVACIGALAMIVSGVLTEDEAIGAIHGPTLFLFVGMLPLSDALRITGAMDVVADKMLLLLGNTTNPYIIMTVFLIVPLILTQVMSNVAAVAVFVPIVASMAVSLGIDPRAGVMAVMIATPTSILTPMASSASALIMGPGGYKLKDYIKCGLPLVLVNIVIYIFYLPVLFPF